jgi:hypothetical protein
VTINEIAAMCGVSAQTVSRVINGRPDVSPATRAAVEAAIARVGFQPSAVARSLVHRRSKTLGVIAAGLRYFGVAQTLNGITEESETQGFALLLKEIPGTGTNDLMPVIEFLMAHRVEGIIFAAPDLGDNLRSCARDFRGPRRLLVEPSRIHDHPDRQLRRGAGSDGASGGPRAAADRPPSGPTSWHEARDANRAGATPSALPASRPARLRPATGRRRAAPRRSRRCSTRSDDGRGLRGQRPDGPGAMSRAACPRHQDP